MRRINMRECPKCGRRNEPTRKFCVRCGASLLKPIESEQPSGKVSTAKKMPVVTHTNESTPSDGSSRSTNDRWVRPSQVSTDRVRHAERHTGKTEMEKAMEVFKKAESVGIEEESGDGIIEPRMLRASEVKDLLESAESFTAQPDLQPTSISTELEEPIASQEPVPAAPTPKDIEESLLGSKSEYVEQPPEEPPAKLEPVSETAIPPGKPPTGITPHPPVQKSVQPPGVSPPSTAPPSPPSAAIPPAKEASPTPKTPLTQKLIVEEEDQTVTEKAKALLAKIPRPEYLQDSVIQKIIADFKELNLDLRKVEVELDNVHTEWTEKVRQILNEEETKRLQYEGLVEQVRLAKADWERAVKNRKDTESKKRKEISSKEKRIKEINKTMSQVEKSLERRVRDLEKERLKNS